MAAKTIIDPAHFLTLANTVYVVGQNDRLALCNFKTVATRVFFRHLNDTSVSHTICYPSTYSTLAVEQISNGCHSVKVRFVYFIICDFCLYNNTEVLFRYCYLGHSFIGFIYFPVVSLSFNCG